LDWQAEISSLPFQPEEEEILTKIIDGAQEFRMHISALCDSVVVTLSEAETQRFYLRKIEGAEVLLDRETNFFRQELHKWSPVAPEPPPLMVESKSTRKPRPTKLQKLLHQYGVDDPDDLPEDVKGKANSLKRKALNAEAHAEASRSISGISPATKSPSTHGFDRGGHHFFGGAGSPQPRTPGLSIASSSHAHPSRGPDSSSSSHSNPFGAAHGRSDSNSGVRSENSMDIDGGSGPVINPNLFLQNGSGTGPHLLADDGLTMEEKIIQGKLEDGDLDKALEVLGQSEVGRRKAEEVFGKDVWATGATAASLTQTQVEENEGDVDRMFTDLVNQDEDEEGTKREKDTNNGESSQSVEGAN
jgi:[histone H3]-trimethyl-L-lysine4 demethylase